MKRLAKPSKTLITKQQKKTHNRLPSLLAPCSTKLMLGLHSLLFSLPLPELPLDLRVTDPISTSPSPALARTAFWRSFIAKRMTAMVPTVLKGRRKARAMKVICVSEMGEVL